jgi:four helix bundle protein
LLKSGTSVGANISEAQGTQSKKDFRAKMSIAYKEAKETDYWIRILQHSEEYQIEGLTEIADILNEVLKMLNATMRTTKEK